LPKIKGFSYTRESTVYKFVKLIKKPRPVKLIKTRTRKTNKKPGPSPINKITA